DCDGDAMSFSVTPLMALHGSPIASTDFAVSYAELISGAARVSGAVGAAPLQAAPSATSGIRVISFVSLLMASFSLLRGVAPCRDGRDSQRLCRRELQGPGLRSNPPKGQSAGDLQGSAALGRSGEWPAFRASSREGPTGAWVAAWRRVIPERTKGATSRPPPFAYGFERQLPADDDLAPDAVGRHGIHRHQGELRGDVDLEGVEVEEQRALGVRAPDRGCALGGHS